MYDDADPRRWAANHGMTDDEYAKAVADRIGGMARDADLVVRLDESYLPAFLKGHVANQHEVGHSDGMYNPVLRARAEAGAWDIEGAEPDRGAIDYSSPAAKFAAEHPDRFPIYGYFSQGPDWPVGAGDALRYRDANNASQYGAAKLVLRPEVKQRAFLFMGDSLGPIRDGVGVPTPALSPSPLSAQVDPLQYTALGPEGASVPWPYTEAEIFGGVRPEDVDHVELAEEPSGDLALALEKAGVAWTVGQQGHPNTLSQELRDRGEPPLDSPGRAMDAYAERAPTLRRARWGEIQSARKLGVTVDAYRERVAARLRELTAPGEASVAVRMPTEGLLGLLRDGRAKTQHETFTSGGWQGDRTDAETPLFGEPESPTDWPVYGYLTTPDEPDPVPENPIVAQYGPWRVVLRDSVRPRTTIFFGDSLSELDTATATPVPLDAPTADAVPAFSGANPLEVLDADPAAPGTPLFFNGWLSSPVAEAQVHGGVTLADVESVEYRPTGDNLADPRTPDPSLNRKVVDLLAQHGIPLTVRPRVDDVPTSGVGMFYSPGRASRARRAAGWKRLAPGEYEHESGWAIHRIDYREGGGYGDKGPMWTAVSPDGTPLDPLPTLAGAKAAAELSIEQEEREGELAEGLYDEHLHPRGRSGQWVRKLPLPDNWRRTQGPALRALAGGASPELTDDERAAVRAYVSTTSFNDRVRKRAEKGEPPDARMLALDSAIAKGRVPRDVTLYRGVRSTAPSPLGFWRHPTEPGEYVDAAYMGATTDRAVATNDTFGPDYMELRVPAGTPALAVPQDVSSEREVLLPRNARVRVVGTRSERGRVVIEAEVVGFGPDLRGRLADAARAGGATLDLSSGEQPSEGFAVAYEGHSGISKTPDFLADPAGHFERWLAENADAVDAAGHVGVWRDDAHGEVVLDPVEVFPPDRRDEAIAAGRRRDQQSIYDLGAGAEIPTGGTGGREGGA